MTKVGGSMNAENKEYESEETVVVLTDDDGNDLELEYLDRISYKGSEYAVMIPPETDDDSDEAADVVILRVEPNDDDTESYIAVEDENILKEVFEVFKERFKDYFDFE